MYMAPLFDKISLTAITNCQDPKKYIINIYNLTD